MGPLTDKLFCHQGPLGGMGPGVDWDMGRGGPGRSGPGRGGPGPGIRPPGMMNPPRMGPGMMGPPRGPPPMGGPRPGGPRGPMGPGMRPNLVSYCFKLNFELFLDHPVYK